MRRGPLVRLGRLGLLTGATLVVAAGPAQAAWLELSVRGAGTVTSQSSLESAVSLSCTGTAASTAAAPTNCRAAYPLQPNGAGGWTPQQLTVRAAAATGWRFAGFGTPPAGGSPLSLALDVTTPLVATFVNAAPAATIDPLPASVTAGTSVPLTLRATDDGKVVSATIEVRGPSGAVLLSATKPALPLTATWSTGGLAPGTYTVAARATDDGGSTGTAAARSLAITTPAAAPGGSTTGGSTPQAQTTAPTPVLEASADAATGTSDAPRSGAGAPERAGFRYVWASRTLNRRTTFTKLTIRQVTAGAKLSVSCRGRGCPKRARLARSGSRWTPRALVGQRLRAGVTIELQVTKPGTTGRVVRLRTHPDRAPSTLDLCLPPGAKRATACS